MAEKKESSIRVEYTGILETEIAIKFDAKTDYLKPKGSTDISTEANYAAERIKRAIKTLLGDRQEKVAKSAIDEIETVTEDLKDSIKLIILDDRDAQDIYIFPNREFAISGTKEAFEALSKPSEKEFFSCDASNYS